ncbi:hypothetical protein B0T24DRAFT_150744 [Lasiosphaeria ovina]|uniref:Uncharacterized protein n=1 Tax=Lasiosphaeria ovina TaxID=92902 RepID=A0AAE0KN82_9PEZI|nr:hypothetical protein B0T24DRAFT_150744 [Lasiosphaeria ovina]
MASTLRRGFPVLAVSDPLRVPLAMSFARMFTHPPLSALYLKGERAFRPLPSHHPQKHQHLLPTDGTWSKQSWSSFDSRPFESVLPTWTVRLMIHSETRIPGAKPTVTLNEPWGPMHARACVNLAARNCFTANETIQQARVGRTAELTRFTVVGERTCVSLCLPFAFAAKQHLGLLGRALQTSACMDEVRCSPCASAVTTELRRHELGVVSDPTPPNQHSLGMECKWSRSVVSFGYVLEPTAPPMLPAVAFVLPSIEYDGRESRCRKR